MISSSKYHINMYSNCLPLHAPTGSLFRDLLMSTRKATGTSQLYHNFYITTQNLGNMVVPPARSHYTLHISDGLGDDSCVSTSTFWINIMDQRITSIKLIKI